MDLNLLKTKRKNRGYTQSDMAKKLGYSGKSGYSCLEAGKVKISIETSLKIKEALYLSEEEYKAIFLS